MNLLGDYMKQNSLSNRDTKQRSGRCSRDIRFPFLDEENSYFRDERNVALQVWVRKRTVVKIKIAGV